MKRNSIASAPSSTSRSEARTPTISASSPCRTDLKVDRHKRFMLRQQAISAKKLAAKVGRRFEVIVDEGGAAFGQGPHQGRRAADRRLGPYRYAPPVAGGRHRHSEGGPAPTLTICGGLRCEARPVIPAGREAADRESRLTSVAVRKVWIPGRTCGPPGMTKCYLRS